VSDVVAHVYGVVPAAARLPEDLTGRNDQPVRRVEDEALAVLISDVEDDARVRRADLLAHAHLLEGVAAETTVVPSRFGVLLPDDETVRHEFLELRRDQLLGLLVGFAGCVLVTVPVTYDEQAALREVLRRDPALAALRDSTNAGDQAGQMRLGEAIAGALASLRGEAGDAIVERLRPLALAVALNEVRAAYEVASIALLVRREDRTHLDATVGDLGRQLAGQMTVRYVGPQPPYAFLDHVVTREQSWA
jgi:hypothetical protein